MAAATKSRPEVRRSVNASVGQ